MINLSIIVTDLSVVLISYTHIRIQRANDINFTTGVTTLTDIPLVGGTSIYYYNDVSGTTNNWYRSQYRHSVSGETSEWSDIVQGEGIDYFPGATYPVEQSYSVTQRAVIDNIRTYIGDKKSVEREYVDSCYSDIMGDQYTYILPEKGWPLKIILTNSSGTHNYYTEGNPTVYDYRYLFFNEVEDIIDSTSTLDIWYETFKWSDREIYERYTNTGTVPGMKYGNETSEMVQIYCAILILKSEFQRFASEAAVRVEDDIASYNPTPAIEARRLVIDNLEQILSNLVKTYGRNIIEGVRIE